MVNNSYTINKSKRTSMWNLAQLLMLCSMLTYCSNSSDIRELKNVFKDPEPGTKGMTFVRCHFSVLQSIIEDVNPSGVDKLHITLEGLPSYQLTVNLTFLWSFTRLTHFWITSVSHCMGTRTDIEFMSKTNEFLPIRHLHYNLPFSALVAHDIFPRFLASMNSLQVLDLKHTRLGMHLPPKEIAKYLSSHTDCTQLYAISLGAICTTNCNDLDLEKLLRPLNNRQLDYLDLSHNNIYSIHRGLNEFTANLKIIDVSYNNLDIDSDQIFIYGIICWHKKIQIFKMEEQGTANMRNEKLAYERQLNRKKRNSDRDVYLSWMFFTGQFPVCLEENNTTLAGILQQDKSFLCKIVNNCAKPDHIPCDFIPTAHDFILNYLDTTNECWGSMNIIPSPQLEELHLQGGLSVGCPHVLYSFGVTNHKQKMCIKKSNIKQFHLDNNKESFAGLQVLLQNLIWTGMDKMQTLTVSGNQMVISFDSTFPVSPNNLIHLNLANNFVQLNFNKSSHSTVKRTFPLLQHLDISFNNLSVENVPEYLIYGAKLLKHLNLAGNKLETVHLLFNDTPQLSLLNMSRNRITHLNSVAIDTLHQLSINLEIDLTENQLICGCPEDVIRSIHLLQNSEEKYRITFTDYDTYTCQNGINRLSPDNVNLKELEATCLNLKVILGTVLGTAIIFASMIVSVIVYKYRYHIKTSYYRFKWKLSGQMNNEYVKRFRYDAFICYCAADRFWVHETLMKILEETYGFRLCIHYRDFIPGMFIGDAIVESITSSRCVIVVLSNVSLKSGWCEFELHVAHERWVREKKKLIIIKLEKIDVKDETPSLIKELLDCRVFMSWPTVGARQNLFWNMLSNNLYNESPGHRSCLQCCKRIGHEEVNYIAENNDQLEQTVISLDEDNTTQSRV